MAKSVKKKKTKKSKKPARLIKKKVASKKAKPVLIQQQKKEILLPGTFSEKVKRTKMRIIGIGGGAGNIISEIASRVGRASFAAANTDLQALKSLNRNVSRFQFGVGFTHGLGTGLNIEIAQEAALAEKEKIKKLFLGQDLCVLVASLGGGTGSGATPIFAKIAKNTGAMTIGVFTMPFKFEGGRKMEIAKESLHKIRPYLNAVVILPNESIFQIIEKETPLREALSRINKNLADSLEGLAEMIYLPGLINIDFADVRTILQGQGRLAYLNTVEVHGANRVVEAIKKVLSSPLYPYTIKGAKGVLYNITGEKEISLAEVSQISKTISEQANSEARIIFGICQDARYQDKIKVALLATGCAAKVFPAEAPDKPKKAKPRKKTKKTGKAKEVKKNKKKRPRKKPMVKKPKPPKKEIIQVPVKVRKNALQVKKEAEQTEKEIAAKESFWETPPFLRKIGPQPPTNPPTQ